MASLPYEGATSGMKARDELVRILKGFGCESVGFMDDFEEGAVILAFKHRGRPVQLRASGRGWANAYLKKHPWRTSRRRSRHDYEHEALEQGLIAVNSILRDWVKGQVTAVETGILSFEAVFMPHMLTKDGRSVLEQAQASKLLPAANEASA